MRGGNAVEEEAMASPDKLNRTQHMTLEERWLRTSALWPYMVPLILVYFAEYSMQVTPIPLRYLTSCAGFLLMLALNCLHGL